MSFDQIVREYMNSQDPVNTVEEQVERTSWLRKLVAPALGLALGLGLSLAGCGGEEVVTDDGTLDDSKADSLNKKSCYTNKQCGVGRYCKKAPVITPKYGITPNPNPPTVTPKYGISPAPPTKGVCTPLQECYSAADCQDDQRCEGATKGSSCPKGAYCILPPPSPGICMNTCDADKDCAKGETCVGESSGCPEGAYCILPPGGAGTCEPVVECETDADCPDGSECVQENDCPPGAYCILPPSGNGTCVTR